MWLAVNNKIPLLHTQTAVLWLERLPQAEECVVIQALPQAVIGTALAACLDVATAVAIIAVQATVFFSALVADIAWFILVTVSHTRLTTALVIAAAKHRAAAQLVLGFGSAEVKAGKPSMRLR